MQINIPKLLHLNKYRTIFLKRSFYVVKRISNFFLKQSDKNRMIKLGAYLKRNNNKKQFELFNDIVFRAT